MIGNKAKSLLDLEKLGLPVPSFFILDTSHYKSALENEGRPMEPTEKFIREEMQKFPQVKSWAVRSSCIKEDGPTTSFAGLFESFMDRKGIEEIQQAVRSCWDSTRTERVVKYAERNRLSLKELEMAVVVQEFVEPEIAGVLFTAHPTSGNDQEMLLEYCQGRGENLVSGQVTPNRVRMTWSDELKILEHSTAQDIILEQNYVRDLRKMGQIIQSYYGKPQDIEFAVQDGQIYLVQSRDITRLQFSPEMGEWTTADFRDGGVSSEVVSPLMWSLYDRIFSTSLPNYFHKLKLISKEQVQKTTWYKVFYGRPYWNLLAVKNIMKEVPGFNERNFDQDMSVPVTYEGDGVTTPVTLVGVAKAIPTLLALNSEFEQQRTRSEKLLNTFGAIEEKYRDLNLKKLTASELSRRLRELILQDHNYVESEYFQTIYNASNAKLEFLNDLNYYRKIDGNLEYVHLISDLGEIAATRPPFELARMATRHKSPSNEGILSKILEKKGELTPDDLKEIPGPLGSEIRQFIEKYYFHSERELDLRVPRWNENPRFIVGTLRSMMAAPSVPSTEALAQHKTSTYQRAFKLLKSCHSRSLKKYIPGQWAGVVKKLQRVRHFLWLREELRDLSTRMYYFIRMFAKELAERHDLGDAVYYVSVEELMALASGEIQPGVLAQKGLEQKYYAEGYRFYKNPNEIGFRYNAVGAGAAAPPPLGSVHSFRGIGCSAGRVRARARVLTSISESERLQPGDVLVAKFTDPGWTPLFGLISGVICESGGLLSHAALISREYGIPSVLNVTGATELIKDGQMIEICGTKGEVFIL